MEIPKNPARYMWFIAKKSRKWLILALVAVSVAELISGGSLLVLRNLTDTATKAVEAGFESESMRMLWIFVVAYPLIAFVEECVWRLSGLAGMRLITKSEANSMRVLFEYLIEHSRNYFNSKFAGALVNKISHASDGLSRNYGRLLWEFYPLGIGLIVDLVIVATIDWRLALIFVVWTAIFFAFNVVMVRRKQHLAYAFADANSELKGKMVDTVSNIASVHAQGHQSFERRFVRGFINDFREKNLKSWMASEFILFMNGVLLAIFALAMLSVAVLDMSQADGTVGSLVLIITMLVSLMRALFFIGSRMTEAIDDYSKIEEGLYELIVPYEIEDKPDAKRVKKVGGKIEFKNVDFAFEKVRVFRNFNLKLEKGEKVGIVGVSGAGKTTLVNLLMRNHDVDKGVIEIDGHDLRDLKRENLRKQIAFVPQDVSLFHRTIADNIRYGNLKATDEELIQAAKKAQAHEFIKVCPDGYKTFVGERGVKLSGGQRQRIAIARAFLKKAPVLVLDEATSALDSESEVLVQAALAQLIQGRTVIAIAHRLSTLRVMDRIVVMDKGRIVEDGTHAELLKKKGVYAELWNHQVEGFIE